MVQVWYRKPCRRLKAPLLQFSRRKGLVFFVVWTMRAIPNRVCSLAHPLQQVPLTAPVLEAPSCKSYNVACATEQTANVKPSKLRSSLEAHCTARRLRFVELTRRRDRGAGERFSRPAIEATSANNRKLGQRKVHSMLYTIAVILLILWLLGLVTSYTLGGFVHILLVVAIIMILVNLISGRRVT
jgi:Family of unknown function (DUF5670)